MKHQIATELLNEYLDGELAPDRTEGLERHVRQCVTCRRELEGLRQLLEGAAALPRAIEPAVDLWPAIAEQTLPRDEATGTAASRLMQHLGVFSWSWPTALATAAVVGVLFISSFNTEPLFESDPNSARTGFTASANVDPGAAALVRVLESECLESERELAAYTKTDAESTSAMSRMLKENMPVVDRAISEARAAWLASPNEPGLARLLTSAYRAKMALQGRAIRMATES